MSGILNNKERIFDTILTTEGRKQISSGDFRVKFVSFSDRATFYQGDVVSGSADASKRVYLESAALPSDRITFEADDSGKLLPLEAQSSGQVNVFGGKIISGSLAAGNRNFVENSSTFSSLANELLSGSFKNFCKLRSIGSQDFFGEDNEFQLSSNNIEFFYTDEKPIRPTEVQQVNVDQVDSFFQDKKLSHIDNFKYLPPKNKPTTGDPEGSSLGSYANLGQREILTFEQLMSDLNGRDFETIFFSKTSRQNNIFGQFFEITNNNVSKLEVIDFGSFPTEAGDKHVFFVGKVFLDSQGRHTFANIFTMVFEQ